MNLVLIDDENVLSFLSSEHHQSPEDFLIGLEEALETGELTIDEVSQLIEDRNQTTTR